jgi:hypothetical protein
MTRIFAFLFMRAPLSHNESALYSFFAEINVAEISDFSKQGPEWYTDADENRRGNTDGQTA